MFSLESKLSTKTPLFTLSGWQDSNLRPPRPKRGAITGLRYTPRTFMQIYTIGPIKQVFIKYNQGNILVFSTEILSAAKKNRNLGFINCTSTS